MLINRIIKKRVSNFARLISTIFFFNILFTYYNILIRFVIAISSIFYTFVINKDSNLL